MKNFSWLYFMLLLPLCAHAFPMTSINDFIKTAKDEQKVTMQNIHILNDQLRLLSKQVNFYQTVAERQDSIGVKWVATDNSTTFSTLFNLNMDGKPIQFCRASFIDGIHTGLLKAEGCLITYNGNSLIIQTYEALLGKAYTRWSKVDTVNKYVNFDSGADLTVWKQSWIPIISGFIYKIPLYICKATYNNQNYIGKVYLDECKFALDSKEIVVKDFEVLFGEVMSHRTM